MATIGVQVLFGFLLAIPFTTKFPKLENSQQTLYTGDLVLAAIATAFPVSPVAHHRLMFGRHSKYSVLRMADCSGSSV